MKGFIQAASVLAIVAGSVAISMPANAADYGGDCCADLEERVAELEATAVRHANRKVSLTISGSVTEAVIFWDDGYENDVNVIVPDAYGAGLAFKGEGNVSSDVSVGYVIALDVRHGDPADGNNKQDVENGAGVPGTNNLADAGSLQNYNVGSKIGFGDQFVYLNSKSAGRLSMGKLGDAYSRVRVLDSSTVDMAAGLNLVDLGGLTPDNRIGIGWGTVLGGLGDVSGMLIRYDSPSLAGFTVSTSWGNDDTATASLAWAGSFSGTNVGVGVGYSVNTTAMAGEDTRISYNASISNDPTGLFLSGAYEDDLDDAAGVNVDTYAWQIKGGWAQNVNGLGKTSLYALYTKSNDLGIGTQVQPALPVAGAAPAILSSEAHGIGVVAAQDLDSVGATLFVRYDLRSVDELTTGAGALVIEDLTTIAGGMTVRF